MAGKKPGAEGGRRMDIAAVVTTFSALVAIFFTFVNYNKEAPYFAILNQPTLQVDRFGYRFELPLKNIGGRAASKYSYRLYFFNQDAKALLYERYSTVANAVGPDEPTVVFDQGAPEVLNRVSDNMIHASWEAAKQVDI
jgi:hypothetical protein